MHMKLNVLLPKSSHVLQYGIAYIAVHLNTIRITALTHIVSPLVCRYVYVASV